MKKLSNEVIGNAILVFLFSFFLSRNIDFLLTQFKVTTFVIAIFNATVVFLAIIRRKPKRISLTENDLVISLIGSYSAIFLVTTNTGEESFILQVLSILGMLFSILGLISLNRSFGILPADRGIVTNGLYRFIRHPIYTGYFISTTCFIFQNLNINNIVVFCIFIIFETMRIFREERLLKENREYLEYTKKVRWRVIPYIW